MSLNPPGNRPDSSVPGGDKPRPHEHQPSADTSVSLARRLSVFTGIRFIAVRIPKRLRKHQSGCTPHGIIFHMDALSSVVAMKVNCDVVISIMASGLYRLLGSKIEKGYETAKSKHIFHDRVNATVQVVVIENDISIQMQKRAHNPFLIADFPPYFSDIYQHIDNISSWCIQFGLVFLSLIVKLR
jgi:hypothetical protein